MSNLAKPLYKAKAVLLFLILGVSFLTYTFAVTRIYYAPSNIYPILNLTTLSNTGVLKVDSAGVGVSSYGADIQNQATGYGEKYPNNKLTVTTDIYHPSLVGMNMSKFGLNQTRSYSSNIYNVREFAGTDNSSVAGLVAMSSQDIGALFVTNSASYYLTSAYIDFFVSGLNATTKINGNPYDILSGLNIYFWACPAVKDNVAPDFPNNSSIINSNPNFPDRQINRQYRDDFSWIFSLLDNSITQAGSNGWINTPDFDAGTYFRPNATNSASAGITNQNGINSGSFVLQIKVATGWNHTTAQTSWSSWATTDALTNAQVPLTAWGKTWRYLDKNYTGDIDAATDISNFGVEELVMISGYVEDRDMGFPGFNGTQTWDDIKGYSYRSGKNNKSFVYYFNQGMRPWFNTTTSSSYTHVPTCVFDLDQYQTGFAIHTISGYLRDDWAGIDISTVQIVVTGTIANIQTGKTYTQGANLTLTPYSITGTGCRTDAGSFGSFPWGNSIQTYPGDTTVVCDDGNNASTGNYTMVFSDTTRSYDPEDTLYVSVSYKDLKGKQGRPVTCSWGVNKNPRFIWTPNLLTNGQFSSAFDQLMVLSNYPNGAQILPINIQLQDDWAGVDTGSISGSISGQKLNIALNDIESATINLAYNTTIYTQTPFANLWINTNYPNYNNWLGSNIGSIPTWQALNYELLFAQTGNNSSFTGNFAAEHPINLTLTFDDKSGLGASNPINVTYTNNAAPIFWEHGKTTNFTAGVTQKLNGGNDPIGTYLMGEMAKLFSGSSDAQRIFPYDLTGDNPSQVGLIKQTPIAFKTTDNRAGVDTGSIVLTITGNRRGMPYTYVFTATALDLQWFDRGDNGGWNLLNYEAILANHNIYFDRQSRGGVAPVPGRASRYTINIQASDLKKPTANTTTVSFTRDMENLSCQYLDRCNARLYFTYDYGTGVVPVVATGVHPFLGQTLYVIASGNQIIYTGVNDNYIACNGAGTLTSPITIDFANGLLAGAEPDPYTNYQHSELVVMDGMFELSGDTLIVK